MGRRTSPETGEDVDGGMVSGEGGLVADGLSGEVDGGTLSTDGPCCSASSGDG